MDRGNFAQARTRLEESLEIQLPLGAPGYVSTMEYLSKLAMYEGKWNEARAYGDEVRTMCVNAGMTMAVPYLWSLPNAGYIALQEGNRVQAREMFGLAIEHFDKANRLIGKVYSVEGLASLSVSQKQYQRAVRLFAWADAVREQIDDRRPPVEQVSVEKDLAIIHSQLDDAEFARLTAEGCTMTTEQAIALALEN